MGTGNRGAYKVFELITAFPKTMVLVTLVAIGFLASFIPGLTVDTTSDSFVANDKEVLVYRDKVREIFGLKDPIVVAVVSDGPTGIFNPDSLALVGLLSREIAGLANVDPDGITSLATESNIVGTDEGMEVTEFFDPLPVTQAHADRIRSAIDNFPLYQGSLVARDGTATLIVAELIDQSKAQATYEQIMAFVAETDIPDGNNIHIAGEGAVSGYLSKYISKDAKTLQPLAALIITAVLFIAFRSLSSIFLPNLIVLGTIAATFGTMAASGVSFYVITNGLATILIGIAVADSVHILSQVYGERARRPEFDNTREGRRDLVCRAMSDIWKPVTLTTITTVAGFTGLWLGSDNPPMEFFGLFAAIGVAAAWVFSMLILPAAIVLVPFRQSRSFKNGDTRDRMAGLLQKFGGKAIGHHRMTLALSAIVVAVGLIGSARVIIQESRIESFQTDEPIYIADTQINQRMDGTHILDIVVETDEIEGLFRPDLLRRIETLQDRIHGLDAVSGSTSVVDYIKQMHKAVNENRQAYYTIPDDEFLIAQLFLMYSTSGDPDDFEEEINTEYNKANIRFSLPAADYRLLRKVIPEIQAIVADEFNNEEIHANLSGRVMVLYSWLNAIGKNHVRSVMLSLLFVWIAAVVVFRSFLAGTLSLLPVGMSVLMVYAFMGFNDIWLGVGTSMFAAIAVGLGIDFSIHTLDRMKNLLATGTGGFDERLADLFPSTGRALFFNFAAIALGFLVLRSSQVPPLIEFGTLVAIAITTSFLASMTFLPALVKVIRPRFLFGQKQIRVKRHSAPSKAGAAILLLVTISLVIFASRLADAKEPDPSYLAEEIVASISARADGAQATRNLKMELIDRRGKSRIRETLGYRRYFGAEKRTIIFFQSPTNVKGTAFLTYDYAEPDRDDDQWLYLPALKKVRRISASDRGDAFLGTDFSYEDIKKEGRIEIHDYAFEVIGEEIVDGHKTILLEGTPANNAVAQEIGYSRVHWYVDPEIWITRKSEMWDVNGNRLKTIENTSIENIQGIWTALHIQAVNHKTGHSTIFDFSNVDYETEVAENMFEQRALRRGR